MGATLNKTLGVVGMVALLVGVGSFAGSLLNRGDSGMLEVQLPSTPLSATATDSTSKFAMATGIIDQDVEAVYFLDFLTGELNVAVLSLTTGQFTTFYKRNVAVDLEINQTQNPQFLMVTGLANLRRGSGQLQPAGGVCYVAEITTGRVAAYALPWNASMKTATRPSVNELILLHRTMCRSQATAMPAAGTRP